MTRTWIATVAALCLQASVVSAQVQQFTVSTPSASIYKAPTNVSPVIGEATQGVTLEVTRDVGSWVKVAWSKAPDGVGYIRKSAGTVSLLGPAVPVAPASSVAAAPQTTSAATSRSAAVQNGPAVRSQPSAVPAGYVTPTHRIGLGGQVGGSAIGAGFSARGWSPAGRLGVQVDVTRYSMANDLFLTRMSSTQFGPRVLYAFRDRVSDSTWLRPFVGAGAHVLRSTVTDPLSGVALSDTRGSAQVFGGAEMTLSAMPRLGVSADLGYQWYQNPFAGYALDGMSVTLAAHWYLK